MVLSNQSYSRVMKLSKCTAKPKNKLTMAASLFFYVNVYINYIYIYMYMYMYIYTHTNVCI